VKRHKAPGLSGLLEEMIQATGDTGTQWILDLCNGIVKEGCIPEDWKSNVVLPIYKGKGDPMDCTSYRGIKLLENAMKADGKRKKGYNGVKLSERGIGQNDCRQEMD